MESQISTLSTVGTPKMPSAIQNIKNKAEAEKAAHEFETMFFTQILRNLFEGVENSSLWGEGHSSQILKPMWIEAIAQSCTGKDLKLSGKIRDMLLKKQGIEEKDKQVIGGSYNVTL